MCAQRHLIKRQLIELTVPKAATAAAIQEQVSRIYQQKIVPLIEQCCSELSAADSLYRIDLIELDLGRVNVAELETQLVTKVEAALRTTLVQQIRQLDQQQAGDMHQNLASDQVFKQGAKTLSALELFALFASSGNLPWWADHAKPTLLLDNMRDLLASDTAAFATLLRQLVGDAFARQRIVTQYDEPTLAQLCARLAPTHRTSLMCDIAPLMAALQNLFGAHGKLRQYFWHNCLQVAALGGSQYPSSASFFHAVLERLANDLRISVGNLLCAIQTALQEQGGKISFSLRADLRAPNTLTGTSATGTVPTTTQASNAETTATHACDREAIQRRLDRHLIRRQLASDGRLLAAWQQLQASTPRFSDQLLLQIQAALHGPPRQAAAQIVPLLRQEQELALASLFETALATPAQAETAFAAWLRNLHSRGGVLAPTWAALRAISWQFSAEMQAHWQRCLTACATENGHPNAESAAAALAHLLRGPSSAHGLRDEECARLQQLLRAANGSNKAQFSQGFSDAEELAVGNSGLIILWPFLMGFFTRLGLLENKEFTDLAARQRAVGLLQLLAAEELALPEYLLPLNKLLCGLEMHHPFDFGPSLKKREVKECGNLLEAVIAQVPILNNMSVAGFRGSFLLRAGLLSRRDGHWLLRVERQSYDIVLERFPWSWSWVKLPWMDGPLRVEW